MKLPIGWQLPDSISNRLGETLGRQRAIIEDEHLLLILHEPPRAGEKNRQAFAYWRDAEGQWKSSIGAGTLGALRAHFDTYGAALDELETRLDKAQNSSDCFVVLEAITPLHRSATNGANALQAARTGLPDVKELITLRDLAGDIERRAELLHADAKNSLDFQIARQNEEQSRFAADAAQSAHRFNLVAAIFLPITALASIFGMNLKSGLEDTNGLFWIVFLVGALGGGVFGFLMGLRPKP